jgi:hypothetical protein
MAQTVTLGDPVWREDIYDQETTARGGAMMQDVFIQRLLYQGAPPELVSEMQNVRALFEEAMDRLSKIRPCFYPEPR